MRPEETKKLSHHPPSHFSCSSVTFREYELPRALDVIAGFGFTSVDLGALAGLCEHVPPRGTAAELRDVATVVRASGLQATSVNADPGSFNGADDAETVLGRIERLLTFCAEATVPRLVLTCGEPEVGGTATSAQLTAVAEGLNRAADVAADYPVELVVEAPHFFRLVNDFDRTRRLLESLDPRVRQAWDVSHVRAAAEDPAASLGEFAHRVSIVHLRDAVPGDIRRAIGFGDVDFEAVFHALDEAGLRVPVVLELETHNSPYQTKEDEVAAALRALAGDASSTETIEARA